MDLEEAKRRADYAIADLRLPVNATDPENPESIPPPKWKRYRIEEAPVPELILFALTELRGLPRYGPHEKLRWAIDGTFRGVLFSVRLEKFGLHLYVPEDTPETLPAELIKYLERGTRIAEAYLSETAHAQIDKGNVTIENKFHRFDGAYRFFRDKAKEAYETPAPELEVMRRNDKGEAVGWGGNPWKHATEGGYYAGAMLNAFFSRLEHELVLVLAFLDLDPSNGALVEFVASTWDEKWRRVFNVSQDPSAKEAYDKLKSLKESLRNPISHGGFAKRGASFFFHVDHLGALPALMTKASDRTFEYFISPVPERTYRQTCEDLDKVDEFLRSSAARYGVKYAESGMDVAFSADARLRYREASQSDEALDDFIEHQIYLADMHANMDY